jgi:sterol desaturase/sphingolipid hydroxylase (fatty acid hydroxylase superfamily)
MSLYLMITVVLVLAGAVMALFTALSRSPYGADHQIRATKSHSLSREKFRRTVILNSVLSLVLVFGFAFALGGRVFHGGAVTPLRCFVEGAAILLVYDFFYYFVHRYPFHEWQLLRRVHTVHHVIKNPTAIDSLYLHPLENLIGLGLLFGSVFLLAQLAGPLSVYSFGWSFLIYSLLNVIVHAGLDLRSPALGLVSYFAIRHNKHHVGMQGKNYASVTPLWDIVFRTEEP